VWIVDEFGSRQNSLKELKNLTKCVPNDVHHLDFGWPGGIRGPAGSGGRVKTLQTWSGRGLTLELSLGFQNLNSLIQHALPSLREGRRIHWRRPEACHSLWLGWHCGASVCEEGAWMQSLISWFLADSWQILADSWQILADLGRFRNLRPGICVRPLWGLGNWETHAVPKRLNFYIKNHTASIGVGSKNCKKWTQVDQKSIKNWSRSRTRIWNAKEFETDATVLSVSNILAPLGWFRCHF
jgi:hypothetical protein